MRSALRALRADLRLAVRPACLVVLVGAAVVTGLASAVMQDVQFEQLKAARLQVRNAPTAHPCPHETRSCLQDRQSEQRENYANLHVQTTNGGHVAALQTVGGAVSYAAAFMGLATGAVIVAVFATLLFAGEWRRRTMALALTGGTTPRALALRRAVALACMGLAAFLAACIGSTAAAIWGAGARPLGDADPASVQSIVGGVAVMLAYVALAAAVAWYVRDAMRTFVLTCLLVAAVALTTALGSMSPGAVVASALHLHRVLEFEVGYVWLWPQLSFSGAGGSAAHILHGPAWGVAMVLVAAVVCCVTAALVVKAQRADAVG